NRGTVRVCPMLTSPVSTRLFAWLQPIVSKAFPARTPAGRTAPPLLCEDAGQRIGGDRQCISSFSEVRWCHSQLVGCLIDEREALKRTRAVPLRRVRSL